MKTIRFPDGTAVPALGQGSWTMAEDPARRADEIAALRAGVDLGMTVIDTAEMYADGEAERLVGEAVGDVRDRVFLVGKAYPWNASRDRLRQACEASLTRLGTDRLDLYLLHWRGGVPLAETAAAMERLVDAGLVLRWGVSNLDAGDMDELVAGGGARCQTDQFLYNLARRGPEHALIPWLARRRMPAMAYSPVEQGRLLAHRGLTDLARERGTTPAQLALAWLLARDEVLVIPKAGSAAHVRENRGAADLRLTEADVRRLDDLFPPPAGPSPLEML